MKANIKKVIEIEGIGLFKKEEEWNGLTKWNLINSEEYIITFDNLNSIDMLIKSIFSMDIGNETVKIVFATNNVSKFLKEL